MANALTFILGAKVDASLATSMDKITSAFAKAQSKNDRRSERNVEIDNRITDATEAAHAEETIEAKKWARIAALSARGRAKYRLDAKRAAAELKTEEATAALMHGFAPGIQQNKGDLKPQRDALAKALREQRALRTFESEGGHAAKGWLAGFTQNLRGQGAGGIQELIHVMRASFDSVASGQSILRIFLQQGPQALQAFSLMGGTAAMKFIAGFAVVGAAIGGILASVAIYWHRMNNYIASATGYTPPDLTPKGLGELTAIEAMWVKIKAAIRGAVDEIDSANHAYKVAKDLMDENQSSEKKLLDIRRQTAMDRAGDDPIRNAQVRAQFDKEEHEMEVTHNRSQLEAIRVRVQKQREAGEDFKKQAGEIKNAMTIADDENLTKNAKDAADKAREYMTQKETGNMRFLLTGKSKESEREKDQQIIDDIDRYEALYDQQKAGHRLTLSEQGELGKIIARKSISNAAAVTGNLTADDEENRKQAQSRIDGAQNARNMEKYFNLSKPQRDAARKEQERLSGLAAANLSDAKKGNAEYMEAAKLAKTKLANADAERQSSAQAAYTKDMLNFRQSGFSGSHQRAGSYVTTPPDFKRLLDASIRTANNTEHLRVDPQSPPSAQGPQFGSRGSKGRK